MSWIEENVAAFSVIVVVGGLILLSQLYVLLRPSTGPQIRDKHYFITGGSMGLGRAMALQLVEAGARVTVVARGQPALDETVEQARKSGAGQIQSFSVDVTIEFALQDAVQRACAAFGPVDVLVTCAGSATTGKLMERSMEEHRQGMELNYFGTLHAVRAVLPGMVERRDGHVLFVSSALALTSYLGYAAYSPTKYAIRGLADTLRNEMKPHNVGVYIAYPGQMQTPGFENEQRTKPDECKAIEKSDTMYRPDQVARSIISSLRRGNYNIYCGAPDISVLGMTAGGMQPRANPILDALLLPLLVPVAWIVRSGWDREATKLKQRGVGGPVGASVGT